MIKVLHKLSDVSKLMKVAVAASLLCFSASASAQLTGSYTINSGGAGATNYLTWGAFATDINTNGVSGPVTVTVMTDETLTAPVILNNISGTSSTNTVTIDGNAKVLAFAGTSTNRAVLDFNGIDYLTIKNLTIRNTGTYTGVRGVWIHNTSDYNTLSKNTIEFSGITAGTTSTSSGGAYITFTGSSSSLTTVGTHGSYNVITGNTMTTTNTNSPGPMAGVWIYSSTTSVTSVSSINNNEISNNTIRNFFYYGVYEYNTTGTYINGNDISRAAVTAGSPNSRVYGVYTYYSKADTRAWQVNNNKIHDLPFVGGTAGLTNAYGVYAYYNNYYGTPTGTSTMNGNEITNITVTSQLWPVYAYRVYGDLQLDDNKITSMSQSNSTSYYYGMYVYYCKPSSISRNDIQGLTATSGSYWYGIYNYYPQASGVLSIDDNKIYDFVNSTSGTFGYIYGIYNYFGNATKTYVRRNKLTNIKRVNYYYVYGIYNYYQADALVASNQITDFCGNYGNYPIYSYTNSGPMRINQNTIDVDGTQSSYPYQYCYVYNYSYSGLNEMLGNIISIRNNYGAYAVYNFAAANAQMNYNYNVYNLRNISYLQLYYKSNGYNTMADYFAVDGVGKDEIEADPLFTNVSGGDFSPLLYECQNIVPSDVNNPRGVNGNTRNIVKSDRGAIETMLDLQVTSTTTIPATMCSGTETSVSITVKNTFVAAATNVKVKFTTTGGNTVIENIADTIATGATVTYNFNAKARFNEAGPQTLEIGLESADDNPVNDKVTLSTVVNEAPGGSMYVPSTTTTRTIYQLGGKPDITQINTHSIYDLAAPRMFSNSGYGTDWMADAWIETASGTMLPAGDVVQTDASTSGDLNVDFMTTDASYEDSLLTLKVKFTNITSGCDTILERKILVYPTITPDFTFPAQICDGDAVLFENSSIVQSGGMEFNWDFGTGNIADATQAPEPVFVFNSAGTYTVTMVAKTLPWGFDVTKDYTITVNEVPNVNFTKLNACEGKNLTFTSNTTPSAAVLSWNMGDGNTKGNLINVTHQYANTGRYTVVLSADLAGCVATATQVAYQFDKPVAAAIVTSGICDNEEINFQNNTTIVSGNFGNFWDLDDNGSVSTQKDAKHQFSTPGTKNVKLTVTTDFGCTDNVTIPVVVREAPKVAFTNTAACSIDPTEFTNLTPTIAGTAATYTWNFGDGTTSMAESPTHAWTSLGDKTVSFNISLDNGCSETVTKDLKVGVQPVVNFEAADVCAGDPVIFDNSTTWPNGEISYAWDFADGNTSTDSDPVHAYSTAQTKTYVVTLVATIADGCEATQTKQVTVNEAPQTCDFTYANDYTASMTSVKFTPTGGTGSMTGIDYSWVLGNEGSKNTSDNGLVHEWQKVGTYTVTMRAKVRSTGCECTTTKTIALSNVTATDQLGAVVYPNPSNGTLNIKMNKAVGQEVSMSLMSMTGAVVSTQSTINNGIMTFDANTVSNGVYLLKMVSGSEVSTVKVTIQH